MFNKIQNKVGGLTASSFLSPGREQGGSTKKGKSKCQLSVPGARPKLLFPFNVCWQLFSCEPCLRGARQKCGLGLGFPAVPGRPMPPGRPQPLSHCCAVCSLLFVFCPFPEPRTDRSLFFCTFIKHPLIKISKRWDVSEYKNNVFQRKLPSQTQSRFKGRICKPRERKVGREVPCNPGQHPLPGQPGWAR